MNAEGSAVIKIFAPRHYVRSQRDFKVHLHLAGAHHPQRYMCNPAPGLIQVHVLQVEMLIELWNCFYTFLYFLANKSSK